jgi:hypothetical protein
MLVVEIAGSLHGYARVMIKYGGNFAATIPADAIGRSVRRWSLCRLRRRIEHPVTVVTPVQLDHCQPLLWIRQVLGLCAPAPRTMERRTGHGAKLVHIPCSAGVLLRGGRLARAVSSGRGVFVLRHIRRDASNVDQC